MPDSRTYRDQKFNLNKRPSFSSKRFLLSEHATFNGVIRISPEAFRTILNLDFMTKEKLTNLYPDISKFRVPEQNGNWIYEPESGMIRQRQQPGKDTIGDVRVTFHVAKDFIDG